MRRLGPALAAKVKESFLNAVASTAKDKNTRNSNATDRAITQWSTNSEANYRFEDGDEKLLTERIKISDTKAVDKYFDRQLDGIQQLNCKVIAKAWIKVIEPKKQFHYPYNGSNSSGAKPDPEKTKPDWWPTGVRHRGPDHVKKNGP